MNKQFIQVTNGLIPVVVMALLAVALIAGQARAKLPALAASETVPAYSTSVNTLLGPEIFGPELVRKAESLPYVVETMMTIPGQIELNIRLLRNAPTSDDIFDRPGSHH